MEEKTAKIPSLKDFKESRKERDAHTQRSSSMQTKKQLEKSLQKSREEKPQRKQASRPVKNEDKVRTPQKRTSPSDRQHREKPETAKRRRPSPQPPRQKRERTPDSETVRRPRTYVRDSLNQNSERRPQRRDYSEEPLRQYRSQGERRRPSVENTPVGRPSGQPHRRPDSASRKPVPQKPRKPAKPRKPLTPEMRKFRNAAVYLGLIACVFVVGAVLSLTVLFKTEKIVVTGNGPYSQQDIIDASGLIMGENIFTAPKKRAANKIEKTYPYIEEAYIHSSIPDTIKIDITMAKPAYIVEAIGGFYTVSDKGKVLEVSASDDEAQVPIIEGIDVKAKTPGEYLEYESDIVTTALEEIFLAFRELGCDKITAVNVETTESGTVKLRYVYDDRIVVYLGTPDHLSYKIHTADTILREKIDVNNTTVAGELDVSKSYETKKSYFNEYTILADHVAPTTSATESTVPEETDSGYENSDY